MDSRASLTIGDIAVKAQNKKEVCTVLTVEGGLYLSQMANAIQKYLKEILNEKKILALKKC